MHVYRWDLDRTYLDTDIRSMRGMVRAALEPATAKGHVPGAPTLLRTLLDHDPRAQATLLSGSPTQLRGVLEERLALDGVRFESLMLKDNLRNIRKGRLRALRGQVGYKLPQLLTMRLSRPRGVTETLFGDDAEVDALIYATYADVIAGRVTPDALQDLMESAGAYPDQIHAALKAQARLPQEDAVEAIYIHADRHLPLHLFRTLGPQVHVVASWWQAALGLVDAQRLAPADAIAVARACSEAGGLDAIEIAALAQDAVRRGVCTPQALLSCLDAPGVEPAIATPCRQALRILGDTPKAHAAPSERNFLAFLDAVRGWEARNRE